MSYKIKINYWGNRNPANPLARLDTRYSGVDGEYSSYNDACYAIHDALEAVIDDGSYERVDSYDGRFWRGISANGDYSHSAPVTRAEAEEWIAANGKPEDEWELCMDSDAYSRAVLDQILETGCAHCDGVAATVEEVR